MSLTYPDDRTYHAEHLWAKDEADGTMLIGITDKEIKAFVPASS